MQRLKDVGARGEKKNYELFANGSASNINVNGETSIASPVHCHFLNQTLPPPPPPGPEVDCTVAKNIGCFNATTAEQGEQLLPSYVPRLHDHVTLEGCE